MRGVPPSFFIMNTEKILSKCLKKLNINDKNLTANEFAESKLNILYYIMRAENKLKNFEENIFTEDLIVYYTCLLWSMNTDNIKSAYFHKLSYSLCKRGILLLCFFYLRIKKTGSDFIPPLLRFTLAEI